MKERDFWNPYLSGVLLGLVLLLTFFLFGRGLGASGVFDRLAATILYPLSLIRVSKSISLIPYFVLNSSAYFSYG